MGVSVSGVCPGGAGGPAEGGDAGRRAEGAGGGAAGEAAVCSPHPGLPQGRSQGHQTTGRLPGRRSITVVPMEVHMVCIGNAPVWPVFICCFRLIQIWIIFILTDQQLYFSPINTAALIDWKETAFWFPELHILTAVHQWLIY